MAARQEVGGKMSRREFILEAGRLAGAMGVEVLLGPGRCYPILRVKTEQPYFCIGIDDGWYPEKVERFLKIADDYKYATVDGELESVKFTLFPVGKVLKASPDLWREVKAAGHQIGNHSHDHIYAPGKTRARIKRSFAEFEQTYEEVFGEAFPNPNIARVPFAEGVNRTVQEALYELDPDYLQVHWMRDTYSWQRSGIDDAKNQEFALKKFGVLEPGWIGVMHFTDLDLAVLPRILDLHLKQGGLVNVTFARLWDTRIKQ